MGPNGPAAFEAGPGALKNLMRSFSLPGEGNGGGRGGRRRGGLRDGTQIWLRHGGDGPGEEGRASPNGQRQKSPSFSVDSVNQAPLPPHGNPPLVPTVLSPRSQDSQPLLYVGTQHEQGAVYQVLGCIACTLNASLRASMADAPTSRARHRTCVETRARARGSAKCMHAARYLIRVAL